MTVPGLTAASSVMPQIIVFSIKNAENAPGNNCGVSVRGFSISSLSSSRRGSGTKSEDTKLLYLDGTRLSHFEQLQRHSLRRYMVVAVQYRTYDGVVCTFGPSATSISWEVTCWCTVGWVLQMKRTCF